MYNDVSELLGKTLSHLKREECEGNDALIFITTEGEVYRMTHRQDCCENVYIEDIVGDLEDLVGSPLTLTQAV